MLHQVWRRQLLVHPSFELRGTAHKAWNIQELYEQMLEEMNLTVEESRYLVMEFNCEVSGESARAHSYYSVALLLNLQ